MTFFCFLILSGTPPALSIQLRRCPSGLFLTAPDSFSDLLPMYLVPAVGALELVTRFVLILVSIGDARVFLVLFRQMSLYFSAREYFVHLLFSSFER